MKKDQTVYLRHIIESIEQIENYTHDLIESEFMDLKEAQDAVLRRLEIIGEAVKNISSEFKDRYPNIPWRQMAGMRNALIHEYFEVDLSLVWRTVKDDLPKLKEQIKGLISQ